MLIVSAVDLPAAAAAASYSQRMRETTNLWFLSFELLVFCFFFNPK